MNKELLKETIRKMEETIREQQEIIDRLKKELQASIPFLTYPWYQDSIRSSPFESNGTACYECPASKIW